jgi:ribosomal protein S18 acetylase RimI-like enzyme/putative sterol carrier protein
MQKEKIRILVDRSRDSAWSDALLNIEPDDIYLTTDNKDYLKWSVLKNYDVLTICGYPVLLYKDEEIQAIKQFVELGGGLLLASSTSRFERDVGKDISEMTLNKIARIFGAEFLPLSACKADIITDEHFIRGYHKDDIFTANRAEFAELYEYDIPLSNCGIISVPESANILIHHQKTLEPISASFDFCKGKIIVINDTTFSHKSQRMCRGFLDWLGRNRFSKISGDEHIPDEIPVDEFVKKDMDIEIHYNKFVTDERVNSCLDFAKRIYEYVNGIFPDNQNQKWKIELSPSCTNETVSWRNSAKGAYVSDPMLAYALGDSVLGRIPFLNMLARNAFYADIFHKYFGITGMRLLGFENEADKLYMQIVKQLKELAYNKDDIRLSAIASLELTKLGDCSVAERLIEIAKSQDDKFQLNVKNALQKLGYDFPVKDDLIGMDIEYDTAELKIYATINGQRVAHVFSYVDYGGHFLGNTHISLAYVGWVSTKPEFRRLGLSSLIMRETFAHPSFQRCSCSALCTGTENPAHAMYRDFGFVDMSYLETFSIDLHEEKVEIPEDIIIRSYSPGDEIKMAELANEYYSSVISLGSGRKRAVRMKLESKIIKIAERNGDILGFVEASIASTDKKAEIGGICLKKGDELEKIGSILLKSLHNDLVSQGFNRLEFWNEYENKELLRDLLNKLGYCCRSVGGVNMFKIINLPMFLEEITPLLTKRLKNSNYKDWQGKIGIIGNQHKATVIIENGEISLAEEILSDANITFSADDATITGIVIGKLSPYEAYLQQEMKIKPILNNDIAGLLKTLFPKIPN